MKTKYIRKDKTILNLENGKREVFSSVNKAKKEVRSIHIRERQPLGCGIVSVVDKFPAFYEYATVATQNN